MLRMGFDRYLRSVLPGKVGKHQTLQIAPKEVQPIRTMVIISH